MRQNEREKEKIRQERERKEREKREEREKRPCEIKEGFRESVAREFVGRRLSELASRQLLFKKVSFQSEKKK